MIIPFVAIAIALATPCPTDEALPDQPEYSCHWISETGTSFITWEGGYYEIQGL